MTSISITDDKQDPQFKLTSIQNKTILLEKHDLSYAGLVSLSQDKCLARDLLIQNYEVIARVDNPDGMRMWDTFKVPCMSGV